MRTDYIMKCQGSRVAVSYGSGSMVIGVLNVAGNLGWVDITDDDGVTRTLRVDTLKELSCVPKGWTPNKQKKETESNLFNQLSGHYHNQDKITVFYQSMGGATPLKMFGHVKDFDAQTLTLDPIEGSGYGYGGTIFIGRIISIVNGIAGDLKDA